ncbi:MAG: BMP family ABC transporter substrate-binding protein, partial [Desulfobacteraceae bacterium]|nr:BMP family ABC transporter substrate-binding protein [Desulfobacteraceae bacterium]
MIYPFVLVILFSLFFVSCGKKDEEKKEAKTKVEQQTVEPAKEPVAEKKVEKQLKAGFVYVGPVGDYGWSHAHDQGRLFAQKKLPWLETVIVESVAEADSARIIDRLIQQQNCDVVFTTSFGYMEDTVAAGTKYPDKIFMHCAGFKRAENVGTYFGDLYQMYYLNGMMAGALTKSNKIG